MESSFALSPSFRIRIRNTPKPNNPNPLFRPQSISVALNNAISPSKSAAQWRLSCSWKPVPSLLHDRRRTRPKAHRETETEIEEVVVQVQQPKNNKLVEKLQLGVLIIFWYSLTTLFNIYNKQVLKSYPFPWTISTLHFGIGTLLVLLMWTFNLHKRPNISTSQLVAILPLAIAHTLGNLFTNMSLGKVSVSFTHTIKAMEPFFSVVLSALFLGEIPTVWVVSSLVPVVGGVALASFTEASFDWIGFWSAMASNLTNQSRNVFSKKFMIKKNEEYLDNITLFSIITIMSFVLMVPATLLMEGVKFTPAYLQSAGLNFNDIFVRSLVAGLFYHGYQQVAYVILERVSPVTHSVSNCVKRIVIIVTSVLFFRTPVSRLNCIGTGLAIAGVFLYSRLKQIRPKQKKD